MTCVVRRGLLIADSHNDVRKEVERWDVGVERDEGISRWSVRDERDVGD